MRVRRREDGTLWCHRTLKKKFVGGEEVEEKIPVNKPEEEGGEQLSFCLTAYSLMLLYLHALGERLGA